MRSVVLLLLLLTTALAARAQGNAPLPSCVHPIRFAADYFPEPPTDFTKSATDLVHLGAPAPPGSTALGLVTVATSVEVIPSKECRGLTVQLHFVNPVLRVAKELPQDSCGYEHVLHHEYTHVRIYRDMARQFRQLAYPSEDAARPADVLHWATWQLAELQQAQRDFDSPEEYGKNTVACHGEIPRLLASARK